MFEDIAPLIVDEWLHVFPNNVPDEKRDPDFDDGTETIVDRAMRDPLLAGITERKMLETILNGLQATLKYTQQSESRASAGQKVVELISIMKLFGGMFNGFFMRRDAYITFHIVCLNAVTRTRILLYINVVSIICYHLNES